MSKHAKHRATKAKTPWRVHRHYWLNKWHFFTKPKLKGYVKAFLTKKV